MRLRYPEGMRSLVDATLALQGPAASPVVTGTVTVKNASWTRGIDTSGGLFSGYRRRPGAAAPSEGQVAPAHPPALRRADLLAPSTLRIDNDQARIVASADLTLRGTFDRPLLFGRAEIERGDVEFEGRRYLVTRGSLDFANPIASSRSSTSRPRRACACPARPIASPCAWPARPSGCSRSSSRIRRCRRSTS